MSKWKLILYTAFGPVIAGENQHYGGDHKIFDTMEEANQYGESKKLPYEAVEVKPQKCDDCGQEKPDVQERICGYYEELYNEEYEETVCDECEYNHMMEI